jgi:hypothetical protein
MLSNLLFSSGVNITGPELFAAMKANKYQGVTGELEWNQLGYAYTR